MIKKCTPSKIFIKKERSTSCCKCLSFQDKNQQQNVDIVPKMLKIGKEPHSFTPIKQEQEFVSLSNYTLFTPRTSHLPSRTNSYNKTVLFTTSTVDQLRKTQAKIQLKSSQLPLNPLDRLKRKLTFCSSTKSKHEKQSKNQSRITFCYISANKEEQNGQRTMSFDMGSQKSVQLQKQLEKKLQEEVELYKKEYQQLLQQFKALRQQKQSNKERYEQLLYQIKLKQEQIKALQTLRRVQIENLREQLRLILQEQANI